MIPQEHCVIFRILISLIDAIKSIILFLYLIYQRLCSVQKRLILFQGSIPKLPLQSCEHSSAIAAQICRCGHRNHRRNQPAIFTQLPAL